MSHHVHRRRGSHLRRHGIAYAVVALAVSTFPATAQAEGGAGAGRCQPAFTGGPDADTIHGNARDNVICGLGGEDELYGRSGADILRGGGGIDGLFGGPGADVLDGGPRPDHINGETDRDTVYGGPGYDNLFGGAAADRIYGGDGPDSFSGGRGDDRLWGGPGDDYIRGRAGDDRVWGGPGDDLIDLQHRDRFDTHDSATCGDGTDVVYIDAGGDGHGGRDTVDADCETVIED